MAEMSANKTNNGKKDFRSSALETKVNSETTLTHISQNSLSNNKYRSTPTGVSKDISELATKEQSNLHSENTDPPKDELTEIKINSLNNKPQESIFLRLKTKTAAILVGSAVMLPILAVGTATYYFGSQAVNRQTILAKRANDFELAEAELTRQQKLLAALLMGTGTTALLAGAVAALGTKKLLEAISKIPTEKTASENNLQINRLSQSVSPPDVLRAIVAEARTYLNCDRVVVYSLDDEQCGVVIAESVGAGYLRTLNKTIADPCLEAKYLGKYRDGIRAIDNIDRVDLTPSHKEQLEQLEVKANIVTPIIYEGNLFGLLVAHQCQTSRKWQQGEIEFLDRQAQKAGLAWENARLSEQMLQLQTQAERERKWTQYFTDAVRHIRQSIEQDDVLEISVEEVRRVLNCDRVVVYSLDGEPHGVVVAESVAAGYSRALNKTIADPCFAARYLDKYRDGRVRAIDNIYEAGMSECYLEQLATLEVKANLVTPILNEGKLFGLLVAHQCSQPRHWQQPEIRWMTQIATQVGFALDNAKVLTQSTTIQTQAEKERKWTQYFTDAVRHIRQSIEQDDVLEISVEEVRRVLNCDRVVVYSLDGEQHGVVVAESVAAGYSRALNKTIADPCFAARYLDKYRDGRVRAIDNIYEAGMSECYLEQLATLEVKANLVTPILNEGKLFGLLVAHQCSQPRHWQQPEIRWMTQIATQVGFALDNAVLLKKSQHDRLPIERLNNFSSGINETSDRTQLLKAAVEQARKIIELDRVLVYQYDLSWSGSIVAESVVPGYPRVSNSQFKDPFAEYREKYRQGRVEAIADVEGANLTDSHREQLKSLAVKASLIVPILQGDRLFGLLIGHQCQQTRIWESSEIDLFTQLALQLGSALDRVKLREELDLTKDTRSNKAEQQLESPALHRKISELLAENQAVLQAFNTEFSSSEEIKGDRSLIPTKPPSLPMGEIILEATEIISNPINTLNNYHPELNVVRGEIVERSQPAPNLSLMNQFVGEITHLSDRISQQSLYVTESFQKLAAFAKQLSENSEPESQDEN